MNITYQETLKPNLGHGFSKSFERLLSSKAESVTPPLQAGRLCLVLAEDLPKSGAQVGSQLRQAVLRTPSPFQFTSAQYIFQTRITKQHDWLSLAVQLR